MIGTKKLSEIRADLIKSLGKDPIGRLEKMIAKNKGAGEGTDVAEGLLRFIQKGENAVRRKHKTAAKKRMAKK